MAAHSRSAAKNGPSGKRAIVALVERGGKVRSFHVGTATKEKITKIVRENVAKESRLHTDESKFYAEVGKEFNAHETTRHSAKEYVRYEDGRAIHSNSVEGYFGLFKKGMSGVYQHCGESTFTATLRSSTSATITASSWATATLSAP